jgi:hypothetical protein
LVVDPGSRRGVHLLCCLAKITINNFLAKTSN